MLNDGSGFKKIYLATGYTDLRRGIEGLAGIIRFQFELDPYDRNTLFLFCGKRCDRIKVLLWEGDGFLLMYKRLDYGAFNWPRSKAESVTISEDQFQMLMQGLESVKTMRRKNMPCIRYLATPVTESRIFGDYG